MKKKITKMMVFAMVMLPMILKAQSMTENHIMTKTYKVRSQTSLDIEDPNKVSTAVQYIDGLGRLKQSVLVKGGSVGWLQNRLPNDWSENYSWRTAFYQFAGFVGEQIISGTTPFGDTDLLWESTNGGTAGANGGWTTKSVPVDSNQGYRYSVWVKKTGNLADGAIKHSASVGTFWEGDLPELDTWYLVVGYIHPASHESGDTGISGVYNMQGSKVVDGTDLQWSAGTSTATFSDNFLNVQNNSSALYLWSPLLQKIDGNHLDIYQVIHQSEVIANTTAYKDIVTHYAYDSIGRQTKDFLPYVSENSDGRINTGAELATQSYYQSHYADDFSGITNAASINSYSDKVLEASPLNRILEQTAPGKDWDIGSNTISGKGYSDGHTIRFEYDTNTANEVKLFEVSLSSSNNTNTPSLLQDEFYNEGELFKTITKDENWSVADSLHHTTEEFKNKLGQIILKRTYADVDLNSDGDTDDSGESYVKHDTYYVYDDYGNLTYVLPPKASAATSITATVLSDLCYQYKYDHRNRLVEKKIPGKGWEIIIYDHLNRIVMTQDAIQKPSKKWLFTKYDAFGRIAYTGVYTHSSDINQATMSEHFRSQNTITPISNVTIIKTNEVRVTSGTGYLNTYYSNSNFPNINIELLAVNYYDNYNFDRAGTFDPSANGYSNLTQILISENPKTLSTGSKIKVLGQNPQKWITTVTYYDDKARPVYVYSHNEFLETTDIVESKLDFTGKVLETKTTHKKTGKTDIEIVDVFEYDHRDRLVSQTQKINNKIPERIVKNNYDDLGQLKEKLTGSGTANGYNNVSTAITIDGATATKTGATGFSEGFTTIGSIEDDGYVEFKVAQTDKVLAAGLIDDTGTATFSGSTYGVAILHNSLIARESGSTKGSVVSVELGDVIRIERKAREILYKHNGKTFYVSVVDSIRTVKGAVALVDSAAVMKDFHLVNNSKGLQNVNYKFNVRGWLTSINNDTQSDNDLFDFTLRYNNPTGDNVTQLFNGNISQTSWTTASSNTTGNPVSNLYTYSYDALNRITSAVDNTGNYNLTSVSYDKNGNILTLRRTGRNNLGITTFGTMDSLTYSYVSNSNRLIKVLDEGADAYGFKDGVDQDTEYTYDSNGNMTADANKGITSISYNHLNLPTKIVFNNNDPSSSTSPEAIEYIYAADGTKMRKKVWNGSSTTTDTDYAGNYIYEDNVLQFFNHPEGYVKASVTSSGVEMSYVYQYKDHLGNIRLTYADSNNDGTITTSSEIIEESNYYPFGLKHKGYNNVTTSNGNSTAQKFGYNGKELNDELDLDWYDFGARNYDATLGRWMNLDALAEKYTNLSPYSYVANNVINAIDPDGRLIIFVGGLRFPAGNWDQWFNRGFYKSHEKFKYWRNYEGKNAFGQVAKVDEMFMNMHGDNNVLYTSGSSYYNSKASRRVSQGKAKARRFYRRWKKGKIKLANGEAIRIVSHSQGGAHAAGFAEQLLTYKDKNGRSIFNIEVIYYITPHQGRDFSTPSGHGIKSFQFNHPSDAVAGEGEGWITSFNGGQYYGRIRNVTHYSENDIMGGVNQPPCEGPNDNRCGHNVTDNQQNIMDILNEFCKNNPGKCRLIELDPKKAKKSE